jgi:hypothetical protein
MVPRTSTNTKSAPNAQGSVTYHFEKLNNIYIFEIGEQGRTARSFLLLCVNSTLLRSRKARQLRTTYTAILRSVPYPPDLDKTALLL